MAAYNIQLKKKTSSSSDNVYVKTQWSAIDNKPSWIGSSKPNYVWSEIGSKPTEFNPSSHNHGNITNDGKIGTAANRVIVTGTGGILTAKEAGTTSQFFRGDGNWATPSASEISGLGSLALKSSLSPSDIPNLDTSKITSGTFSTARIPTLAISKISGLQTALDAKVDKASFSLSGTTLTITV